MSNIVFNCPACERPLKLPPGVAGPGDMIVCPCCDKQIRVPQETRQALQQMPTVIRRKRDKKPDDAKPEGKNLFFDCPECKNPLKLPPGIAEPGGRVECPKCNRKIRVPSEKEIPPRQSPTIVKSRIKEKSEQAKEPAVAEKPAADRPATDKPPRRDLKRKLIIGAGAVLIVALALLVSRILVVRRCTGKIDKVAASFAPYGELSYSDIEISPLGRKLTISDIVIRPKDALRPVSISHLILQHFSPARGIPTRLDMKAYGVHIPLYPQTFGKAGPAMRGLDYHCLHTSITCSYSYDPEEKELTVPRLRLFSPTVGSADISLAVKGVNLVADDLSLKELVSAYPAWQVSRAQFEYADDSFIARFLAYQADYIGETVEELHVGMLTDLKKVIEKETDSFTRASLVEFGKFIQNSDYLRITAAPAASPSIAQLQATYDEKGIKGLIPELQMAFSVDPVRRR